MCGQVELRLGDSGGDMILVAEVQNQDCSLAPARCSGPFNHGEVSCFYDVTISGGGTELDVSLPNQGHDY